MWAFIKSAIVFGVIAWVNPRRALWLMWLLIPTYLVKLSVGGLPTNLFELLVVVSTVVMVAKSPRVAFGSLWSTTRSLGWAGGLLLLGLIIGTAVSPNLQLGLGIFKGWFVVPFLLYWLTTWLLRREDLNYYITALVLSTVPLLLMAVWQVVTNQFITVDGRASGWFVSANYLSMYLVPILLLGIILVQTGKPWQRWLTYLTWGLGGVALFFSFSFGGWLGLVGAMLVWAVLHWHSLRWEWIGVVILPVVAIVNQWNSPRFQTMVNLTARSSVSVRWQVWQTAFLMIKKHWFAGIGLGEFRDQYLNYANQLFSPPWETAILHAHNVYLQFWINTGLLGVVGWVWLVVNFFCRLARQLTPQTIVLITAMSAVLIHGLVDSTYWKNDLATLFWLLFAMMTIVTRPSEKVN